MALLWGRAQEKLWLGMPGIWDGAGRKSDALSLAYASWGLCPRPGSVFPVPCGQGRSPSKGAGLWSVGADGWREGCSSGPRN